MSPRCLKPQTSDLADDSRRLHKILDKRCVKHVGCSRWRKIDSAEVERGKDKGKPWEKYTRVAEMLEAADV